MEPKAVEIRESLRPGDIGEITRLHGVLYAREQGFGIGFEAYVARGLSDFAREQRADGDRIWIGETEGRIAGTIAIVRHPGETAQLRWFLVTPEARGHGLGRRLLDVAIDFCSRTGVRSVFLWTVAGLPASAHLYVERGFRLTRERPGTDWGRPVTEQRYEMELG